MAEKHIIICGYASGTDNRNTGTMLLIDLGPENFAQEYLEILELFTQHTEVSVEQPLDGEPYCEKWLKSVAYWIACELCQDHSKIWQRAEKTAEQLEWLHSKGLIFDAIPNPRGASWSEWGKLRLGNGEVNITEFFSDAPTPTPAEIARKLAE